ncbi:hypothetical protein RclHR1_09630005 [Rhizophagus clarus]|uniref:Uncharacterized protein n=1 Tax=Rhizophagus clarus TaxID=94130 RepID=A0A2Z6S734_9GLOM|nr:hypothetical protein RclHR1_09630005 [Rhizophagus clarus]
MYKLGTTNLESELEQELNQRGTRVHDGFDSDSGSGSNSRPEDNSEEQWPNPFKKYLHMSELCKDMRDALQKKRRKSKTIAKLKNLKDPLIEQFKDEELLPIVRDNGYHSPEFSSEDEVNEKNKIVVCNLRWRSSTLRQFLYYVDKNTKCCIKKREWVYRPSEYVEEAVPSDAPEWTKSGYNGPLKELTTKAINKYINK